jgi:DNA modification methylase
MTTKQIKICDLVEVPELKNFYSEQSNLDLKTSIAENGLKTPIIVDNSYTIIDGYRRVHVYKDLGFDKITAIQVNETATIDERVVRNICRVKTTMDIITEIRHVFKKYPKRQGKRPKDESPYVRDKKISDALGERWKGDIMINKVETIFFNDLKGNVLCKGIIEKNWKIDPCYEFLTKWREIDQANEYGFTETLISGEYTITEVNNFIKEKYGLSTKHSNTFVIPDKITVYNKNAKQIDQLLEGEAIMDLQFCSPPYWNLRNYVVGNENQLGHEKTKEEYVENVSRIFEKVEKVLKESGNVVVNIGETYIDGQAQGIPFLLRDAILRNTNLKYKDTLIWSKSNSRPQSENIKRPQNSIEYLLWFVKDPKASKYKHLTFAKANPDVKVVNGAKNVGKDGKIGQKRKHMSKPYQKIVSHLKEQEIGNIVTSSIGKDHELYKIISSGFPAPMSPMLPVTLILMLTDEGDLVSDVFGGSQVTGKIATLLNRRYVSTELSKDYFKIGCERLVQGLKDFDRDRLDDINHLVSDMFSSQNESEFEISKAA